MRLAMGILMGLCLCLAFPTIAWGNPIVIDGSFNDWSGHSNLADGINDVTADTNDIYYWYFATNDGSSNLYFMIQRYMDNAKVSRRVATYATIFIDTNDDGVWDQPEDAVVFADYYPGSGGIVQVRVFRGRTLVSSYSGYWGEGSNRGTQWEFSVAFADIGIGPRQPIRLVLFLRTARPDLGTPDLMSTYESEVPTRATDRCPDTGDLQWAPVPVLGKVGLILLLTAGFGFASYGCGASPLSKKTRFGGR